ncbi:hypothetical protein X975_02733, partial [Stegodyphus mimosarum]
MNSKGRRDPSVSRLFFSLDFFSVESLVNQHYNFSFFIHFSNTTAVFFCLFLNSVTSFEITVFNEFQLIYFPFPLSLENKIRTC